MLHLDQNAMTPYTKLDCTITYDTMSLSNTFQAMKLQLCHIMFVFLYFSNLGCRLPFASVSRSTLWRLPGY